MQFALPPTHRLKRSAIDAFILIRNGLDVAAEGSARCIHSHNSVGHGKQPDRLIVAPPKIDEVPQNPLRLGIVELYGNWLALRIGFPIVPWMLVTRFEPLVPDPDHLQRHHIFAFDFRWGGQGSEFSRVIELDSFKRDWPPHHVFSLDS